MEREYYLDIARKNTRMIFGADLVISSKSDKKEILINGELLGQCIVESSMKYSKPLALPNMDLLVEMEDLLTMLNIPHDKVEQLHFEGNLSETYIEIVRSRINMPPTPRMKANNEAITYVKNHSDLLPMGMCLGPFSMAIKLLLDPIVCVFMESMRFSAAESAEVKNVEIALELCTMIIERAIKLQIAAGAKAICICEPAANIVFISPDVLNDDKEDVLDRLVIAPNLKLKKILSDNNVDLMLHDCGELNNTLLRKLCILDPVILSLGSSRKLWEDADVVPEHIILFGNLPTRQFIIKDSMPEEKVVERTRVLYKKMQATNHPFILGSECDVLLVDGFEDTIIGKVNKLLHCNID